jgi:hypothetical protein
MQSLQDEGRAFAAEGGAVVRCESPRIREVLESIDSRQELQRIGDAAIHVLEGDELTASVRETADFPRPGRLLR